MNLKTIQRILTFKREDAIEAWQQNLAEVVSATSSDSAAVFTIDSLHAVAEMVSHHNIDANRFEEFASKVRHSPVGDIVRSGQEEMITSQASEEPEKHKHLLNLVSYESCIGVPIPSDGEPRYSLFLFSRTHTHFDAKERRLLVKYVASKMASDIQSWQTREILKDYLPIKMHRATMGEIFHRMRSVGVGLSATVANLQYGVKQGKPNDNISEMLEIFSSLSNDLVNLLELGVGTTFRVNTESKSMQVNQILREISPLLTPVGQYLRDNKLDFELRINDDATIRIAPWFLAELLSAILLYGGRNAKHGSRIILQYNRRDQYHAFVLSFDGLRIEESEKETFWESFESRDVGDAGFDIWYARMQSQEVGGDIQVTSAMPLEFTLRLSVEITK